MPVLTEATSVSVANGVADVLSRSVLSQSFDPIASYADWELQLKDAGTLHVDVVAVTTRQKAELVTRGGDMREMIPVQIVVRKRFDQSDRDEDGTITKASIDALCLLVQEMRDQFTEVTMGDDFAGAVWQETSILVCPDRTHLRQFEQFTAVIEILFRSDFNASS